MQQRLRHFLKTSNLTSGRISTRVRRLAAASSVRLCFFAIRHFPSEGRPSRSQAEIIPGRIWPRQRRVQKEQAKSKVGGGRCGSSPPAPGRCPQAPRGRSPGRGGSGGPVPEASRLSPQSQGRRNLGGGRCRNPSPLPPPGTNASKRLESPLSHRQASGRPIYRPGLPSRPSGRERPPSRFSASLAMARAAGSSVFTTGLLPDSRMSLPQLSAFSRDRTRGFAKGVWEARIPSGDRVLCGFLTVTLGCLKILVS